MRLIFMEDRFKKLSELLAKENNWPKVYMFKFVFPKSNQTLAQVEALFTNESEIVIKESEKGNYISVTVQELMLDANSVIAIYQRASAIKGLIYF